MNTPGNTTVSAPTSATGVAYNPATGNSVISQELTNNFSGTNEVHVAFTADNVNAAAASKVYIKPGRGVIANATLPAGVTMSAGDFATYADFVDFINNVPQHVKYIRMQTDNTANYSKQLTFVNNTPNLQSTRPKNVQLSLYRVSTGNGYDDTLTVDNRKGDNAGDFLMIPQLNIIFDSLLKNSTVNIWFGVDSVAQGASVQPLTF